MAGKKGQAPRVEFSQAKFDEMCRLIADGKSLRAVCELEGMPNRDAFNNWRKRTPELQAQYDRAYRDYEDSVLQDIVHIADTEKDAAIARNRIDARKWDLKIRNRKRFGDHLQQDVNLTRTPRDMTTEELQAEIDRERRVDAKD